MIRFKYALLDELVAQAQQPETAVSAARVPRRQIIRVGSLAGAGAAASIAALLIVPTAQESAYAVEKQPDGTVTVTFRELGHAAEATRDLRAAGVPAQVVQLAAPGSCATTPGGTPMTSRPGSAFMVADPSAYPFDGDLRTWLPRTSPVSLTINPSGIPAGAVVFIIQQAASRDDVMVTSSLVHDPAPTCWEAAPATPRPRTGRR